MTLHRSVLPPRQSRETTYAQLLGVLSAALLGMLIGTAIAAWTHDCDLVNLQRKVDRECSARLWDAHLLDGRWYGERRELCSGYPYAAREQGDE